MSMRLSFVNLTGQNHKLIGIGVKSRYNTFSIKKIYGFMLAMQQWRSDFLELSPIFRDLKQILNDFTWSDWPSCQQLNQILPTDIANTKGQCLTLVEQTDELLSDGLYYEERIYRDGVVPTREANWHDFFNAWMFLLFPQTKKEMNRLHVEHIELYGQKKRSKCRDAITLLDECGVLIPYCDASFKEALTDHQWREAFVNQREGWGKSIDAMIIGHANYEKALDPYIGFTGKALFLPVESDFFNLSLFDKYSHLDTMLANNLADLMQDNSNLSPLPMLGVPGWWQENQNDQFYDNTDYFRPKRRSNRVR
ncbi:DUF3025 domain-containing protein [Psychrobium sp. 1_MG-2023]|uniref:DUF3025 domain-containing protein n=1 Tax=Psychrobium sp. 1_MG-2023 TaxID=3062624 RepID=UPI000C345AE4|nr:DUF3025 domain-containing protein [Psychrobium sp. 1_MG-2023]MDP2560129.1 DUF3025 domain-containing protein [Psychrobium sp. 1_MG-2023]PKF56942.1 DUF3025 domain-containing protein [Alteromonadales bacterium alter-6D02]